MDETNNLDAGIIASNEEIPATDGIISEEPDTTNVETDTTDTNDIETPEVIDQEALRRKKNAEKAKKMLAEKNQLESRVAELERNNAIKDLKLQYWDFDEAKVVEIKSNHPTLSYDEAYILASRDNPKQVNESKQDFNWMAGRETMIPTTKTITYDNLRKLSPEDYKRTIQLVEKWDLVLVKG